MFTNTSTASGHSAQLLAIFPLMQVCVSFAPILGLF